MAYQKIFESEYPGGWKDLPNKTTPALASAFNGYDGALEHIEDFLNGSSAVFPITATGGMTQPVGMDEHGRLVTVPAGSGGGSASDVTYDNSDSGLSSTNVQDAIDELAGGGGSSGWTKLLDVTEESSQTASSYDLADSINNYDTICIEVYNSGGNHSAVTLARPQIQLNVSINVVMTSSFICVVAFDTVSSIQRVDAIGNAYIYSVYGYNSN